MTGGLACRGAREEILCAAELPHLQGSLTELGEDLGVGAVTGTRGLERSDGLAGAAARQQMACPGERVDERLWRGDPSIARATQEPAGSTASCSTSVAH